MVMTHFACALLLPTAALSQTQGLKTAHIYYFRISGSGDEAHLTESSASGFLTRLRSNHGPGLFVPFSEGSAEEGSASKLT